MAESSDADNQRQSKTDGASEAEVVARRAAIREAAGPFSGLYPAGYLADLREDWPE